MSEGAPGEHAAAGRALHEALLDQVRLDDLFDDIAFVAERRRQRLNPNRTTGVILANAPQITSVHRIQTALVNTEPQQCGIDHFRAYTGEAFDCRKIPDPA